MNQPFLLGVIALLNLPATGGVTGISPAISRDAAFVDASSTLAVADWADTKLVAGTGTSGRTRAADMQVPVYEGAEEQDQPVISSVSEADPSTEIVWDGEGAPPSEGFLEAPAIPIASWADTKLTRPVPPPAPTPRAPAPRSSSSTSGNKAAPIRRITPDSPLLTNHDEEPGHRFPWGQCTYYVSTQRRITFRGDAKMWLTNGKRAGYRVGDTPIVGSVVVTTESWYGHVGYVEWVSADGSQFKFSEMNYVGLGVVSRRTMSTNDRRVRGFVY